MGRSIVVFLRAAAPFLVTLALCRLSTAWWNSAGVLALIPIFYYTFVRPAPFFALFAVLMCFVLDYNFDVRFVWTSLWCLLYAIRGFQTVLDLTRMDGRAVGVFALFLGIGILVITIPSFHLMPVLGALWTFVWCGGLYLPVTALLERIGDD